MQVNSDRNSGRKNKKNKLQLLQVLFPPFLTFHFEGGRERKGDLKPIKSEFGSFLMERSRDVGYG